MQEKHFKKLNTLSLLKKKFNKLEKRGKLPQHNKGHYKSHHINGTERFSYKMRNKTSMPTFATSTQYSTGGPCRGNLSLSLPHTHTHTHTHTQAST